jgi:antitoxin MazE
LEENKPSKIILMDVRGTLPPAYTENQPNFRSLKCPEVVPNFRTKKLNELRDTARRCFDLAHPLTVNVIQIEHHYHGVLRPDCVSTLTRFMAACCYNLDTGSRHDMRTVVKKWGNSACVRIPAAVMQAARLELDETVDVREESGRVVIEPVERKEYDLADLVKRITPKNVHDEVDFGEALGKEAL